MGLRVRVGVRVRAGVRVRVGVRVGPTTVGWRSFPRTAIDRGRAGLGSE